MGEKQPTLHDVARLANVSHQTVSRVINESPNVAEKTRQTVKDVIRRLNYRPNHAARSLITGRSQTLQVINFNANYISPLPPILSMATQHDYQVSVSSAPNTRAPEVLQRYFDSLTSRIVDGFLLYAMEVRIEVAFLEQLCRGIPYVQLGGATEPETPAVVFDQLLGMEKAMQHLFELGHRCIAAVHGPMNQVDGRVRHAIYLQMMERAGLEPGPWAEGDFTVSAGYERTVQLLAGGRRFSALLCGNDQMALGALHALHQAGLRVPQDVSVVGFDDEEISTYFEPPLTTVRQDYGEQARRGIEYLIQLIEDPQTPREHRVISTRLVVRQSTAAACID